MNRPDSSRPPETVTLAMVAEAAGVSPSTVSRILTGHVKVSDDKRKAVETAISRLDYHPNALARGLAQGRTHSIGVLSQDINSPFYGEALRGIEDALGATGIVPLFVSGHWNLRDEIERMTHLLSRRVDGVIILTGCLPDDRILDYARRVPIVVTGRHLKGAQVVSMRVDDFKGAQLATRHLLDLGHRRIAHIAGPGDHADALERLRGYRRALQEAGVPYDRELVVSADFHESGGARAIGQLLEAGQSFSAVFAANDQSAFGARLALHQRGLRVPDDVSLVGFDDLPAACFSIPPLTTVHQPIHEVGVAAVEAMLKLIGGARSRTTLPEPYLVVRDSTARLRR